MWSCESYSIEYTSDFNRILFKLLAVYRVQNCILGPYKIKKKIMMNELNSLNIKVAYEAVILIGRGIATLYFIWVLKDI